MNAVLAFLSYIMSIFGASAPADYQMVTPIGINEPVSSEGVHIVNTNPRTVVALEDTHFRPSK